MIKTIKQFSALFILITILSSGCSKAPNKVLPKKDGLWTINYTKVTKVGTSNTGTETGAWAATFKDDGTGSITEFGITLTFTWSYDKKNKTITLAWLGFPSQTLNVEEMKAKSEKWTYHSETTSSGVTTTIDETWDLNKVD